LSYQRALKFCQLWQKEHPIFSSKNRYFNEFIAPTVFMLSLNRLEKTDAENGKFS